MSKKSNPRRYFIIITLILIGIAVFALSYYLKIPILWSCLIAMNLITFLFYGYDKRQSSKGGFRIPEAVLHLLALLGGSPAALLAQIAFRHKTQKWQFRIVFALILAVQIGLLVLYFTVLKS